MAIDPLLLFDPDYYRAVNPDLAGLDDVQAFVHFNSLGLDEGRKFSRFLDLDEYRILVSGAVDGFSDRIIFDLIVNLHISFGVRTSIYIDSLVFYKAANPDLAHLSNEEAFEHLINVGIGEGRTFSPYIDVPYYKSVNPELAELSNQEAFEHLIDVGIPEGRRVSPYIDIAYYKSVNPELAELSNEEAYRHLVLFGASEGRTFAPPGSRVFRLPNIIDGEENMPVDPLTLFEPDYYREVNPDLAGLDDVQAFVHFSSLGLKEGRKFSRFLDLDEYRILQPNFEDFDNDRLFDHILNVAIASGWRISYYIDNPRFYKAANPDLAHLSNQEAFEHMINFGIAEGRPLSRFIDIPYYKSVNPEFAQLSNQQAFEHIIEFGIAEGRRVSPYIDIAYYKSVNPDLAELSNEEAFRHLSLFGAKEGRRFAPHIDIAYYKFANPDLAPLTPNQAFRHLVLLGIQEGRVFAPPPGTDNANIPGTSPQPSSVDFSSFQLQQGDANSDLLVGNEANEILSGEWDQDILIGAGGSDIFVLDATQRRAELEPADFIVDFDKAMGDRLGLRGNLSPADLTFYPAQLTTENLREFGTIIDLLDKANLSFEQARELLLSNDDIGSSISTLFDLRDTDRESLETILSSGITLASLDPNGDGILEATAIGLNGSSQTLAFAINTTPADFTGDVISLL